MNFHFFSIVVGLLILFLMTVALNLQKCYFNLKRSFQLGS